MNRIKLQKEFGKFSCREMLRKKTHAWEAPGVEFVPGRSKKGAALKGKTDKFKGKFHILNGKTEKSQKNFHVVGGGIRLNL